MSAEHSRLKRPLILALLTAAALLAWLLGREQPSQVKVQWMRPAGAKPGDMWHLHFKRADGGLFLLSPREYGATPTRQEIETAAEQALTVGPGSGSQESVLHLEGLPDSPPFIVFTCRREELRERIAFRRRFPWLKWLRPLPYEMIPMPPPVR